MSPADRRRSRPCLLGVRMMAWLLLARRQCKRSGRLAASAGSKPALHRKSIELLSERQMEKNMISGTFPVSE